jgi:hypothetical protein
LIQRSETTRPSRSENRFALRIWVLPRVALGATITLLSVGLVGQSHRDAATLVRQRALADASVVESGIAGAATGSIDQFSIGLRVRFTTPGGRSLTVLVRPVRPEGWPLPGRATVKVRYDPANPRSASYAGAGGDIGLSPTRVRDQAFALLALGLLMALHVVWRRGRLRWAFRREALPGAFGVTLLPEGAARPRVVRTDAAGRGRDEWRLLWGQRPADGPGSYQVHELAGWRVLRAGKSVLWPASRCQPVLEAGIVEIPEPTGEPEEAVAIRALMAAYGQIEASSRDLPTLVRRPPHASPGSRWWRLGPAPGAAIRLVVRRHIRRRLRSIVSGLSEAVVGPLGAGNVAYRDAVRSAREDCDEFARRLGRPSPLRRLAAVGVSVLVGGLELYAAYFQVARPDISGRDLTSALQVLYLLVLAFPSLLIVVAQRTLRCARAELAARTNEEADALGVASCATARRAGTVHELERQVFELSGVAVPRDRARYLAGCLWVGYFAFLVCVSAFTAGLGPTLKLVADSIAAGACLWAGWRWLFSPASNRGRA